MINNQRPTSNYSGLCASSYDLLITEDVICDAEFFRHAILNNGQPALEVGCGTGRLLLKYIKEGLDVEGVDLSAEMLAICLRKAKELRLNVTLHQQSMQSLDLPRRFQTIFVPACSFMLLTEDSDSVNALRCFFRHLEPGGTLIVPLLIPWKADVAIDAAAPGVWRLRREGVSETGGDKIRCWERATYDFENQLKHADFRYEIVSDGRISATEKYSLSLRWYEQKQFERLLAETGFEEVCVLRNHTFEPALPEESSFTFLAKRPVT